LSFQEAWDKLDKEKRKEVVIACLLLGGAGLIALTLIMAAFIYVHWVLGMILIGISSLIIGGISAELL
jgi:hypothetical protein